MLDRWEKRQPFLAITLWGSACESDPHSKWIGDYTVNFRYMDGTTAETSDFEIGDEPHLFLVQIAKSGAQGGGVAKLVGKSDDKISFFLPHVEEAAEKPGADSGSYFHSDVTFTFYSRGQTAERSQVVYDSPVSAYARPPTGQGLKDVWVYEQLIGSWVKTSSANHNCSTYTWPC